MKRVRGASTTVTIDDVAKAAGVSTMTVSRLLNQRPNVTEKTARRVRAAIDKLGYAPNHAARVLMGHPSNVIGLIVPTLADVFYSVVAQSVQEVASAQGRMVWIASSNSNAATEAVLITQMNQHQVDGILLIPAPGKRMVDSLRNSAPIVTIDQLMAGHKVDAVVSENRAGAQQAVEHLIGHGYRNIVCLGDDPGLYTMRERMKGYEEAMRAHKLTALPFSACSDVAGTRALLEKLLSGRWPVQAIFTLNNVATVRAIEALDQLGVSVPGRLALLGFADFDLATVLRPPLTLVRQPDAEMGRRAAKLLLDRITSNDRSPALTVSLPTTLIVRESCGCKRPLSGV